MSALATDWHEVWERKGAVGVESYDLETLIALDGFDGGAGAMTPDQFLQVAGVVKRMLGLRPGFRLLEVGCGAGALLRCLRDTGAELYGVDYSAALVTHARAAVPEAWVEVAEATDLPFIADAIVCHSVFQYFPDYEYARRVLRAFRHAARLALILDIPDLATREEAEAAREAQGAKPGAHLYYPRAFFRGTVWGSRIAPYGNAPFRFNALLGARRPRRRRSTTGASLVGGAA